MSRNETPVLVYGGGRSGRAALRLLSVLGHETLFWDDDPVVRRDTLEKAAPACVRLLDGGPSEASSADVGLAVMSPGIPPSSEGHACLRRAGIECISELELAARHAPAPCIVVTGTNGKSSTATMIAGLVEADGRRAVLCGNIGLAFAEVVADFIEAGQAGRPDFYVVEASSYQLALSPGLAPRVAVYTNYAPDHLSWHGGEAGYVEAKASVALRMGDSDTLVFPLDAGPLARALAPSRARKVSLGPRASGATVEFDPGSGTGRIRGRGFELSSLDSSLGFDWRLVSRAVHCTLGLSVALDIPFDKVLDCLRDFEPLEHRLEDCGMLCGVRFINDSKATNIDATGFALRMCDGPLVLVLGGRHKGTPYSELLPFFKGKVKAVVALGEAAPIVERDLSGKVPVKSAAGFEEALELAYREASRVTLPVHGAVPTVLFSPACSSFDMFDDFEQRGRSFKAWVEKRREEMEDR